MARSSWPITHGNSYSRRTFFLDLGANFTFETFKYFCRQMNIWQTITSSYHHHSNGQVEACTKFKCTIKKCLATNRDIYLALLQIGSVPIGAGFLSLETMLFNRPIRGLLTQMGRDPIHVDNDDVHIEALEAHQRKNGKGKYTHKDTIFIKGATVAVQYEDRRPWTHSVIAMPKNGDHRGHSYTI